MQKKHPHLKLDKIKNKLLESHIRKDEEVGRTIQVSYIATLIHHVIKNQSME